MELVLTGPDLPVVRHFRRFDTLEGWMQELEDSFAVMSEFPSMEIDEIFMHIAAMSARFAEIRMRLVRQGDRAASVFRTQQVDKFLDELSQQFKIYSRIFSVRQSEQELSGRAT